MRPAGVLVNTLILKGKIYSNFNLPITDYWKLEPFFIFESPSLTEKLTLCGNLLRDFLIAIYNWEFPAGIVGNLLAGILGRTIELDKK